jgi:hypothetical protein
VAAAASPRHGKAQKHGEGDWTKAGGRGKNQPGKAKDY